MITHDIYTKLIYECKGIDDYGPKRVTIEEAAWDLDMDSLLEMFHGIAIAATYQEGSFEKSLATYLEERGYEVTDPDEKVEEPID